MFEQKINLATARSAQSLNQPDFFANVLGDLAELLETIVGLQDAEGFISTVGGHIGKDISGLYPTDQPSGKPAQMAQILLDLKTRIGGSFGHRVGGRQPDCHARRALPLWRQGHRASITLHDDDKRLWPRCR
ncbi:hypothetical protein [Loktanella sp. R86503]|uniref:hypothetical protein n=1 Tax=Loktanella sp. R86503 TaxID=3093847 RepID=UPI0036DE34EA